MSGSARAALAAAAALGGLLAGCARAAGRPDAAPASPTRVLVLAEGQAARVPGTDVTVAVLRVRDFTGEGCLGGPAGCPDHAEVEVTRGTETRRAVLHRAHTPAQRAQGVDRASVLGVDLVLTALAGRQATLAVRAGP